MTGMRLLGLGRMPWADARRYLEGLQCAWMDLDGWHEGDPPVEAPFASHVWGSSSDTWARVRVDDGDAIVGLLMRSGDRGEPVEVEVAQAVPWGNDKRLPARSQHLGTRQVNLLEVSGTTHVTFVDLSLSS